MTTPEQPEEPELRVTDRRRFTETGEERGGDDGAAAAEPEASEPATPPPASEPPDEPAASSDGPSLADEGPAPDGAPGIEAVFLAFGQSALLNLGFPDPMGQRLPVNLEAAREAISLLEVLRAKTAGNLNQGEEAMLLDLMQQVQMAYVEVARSAQGPGGQ